MLRTLLAKILFEECAKLIDSKYKLMELINSILCYYCYIISLLKRPSNEFWSEIGKPRNLMSIRLSTGSPHFIAVYICFSITTLQKRNLFLVNFFCQKSTIQDDWNHNMDEYQFLIFVAPVVSQQSPKLDCHH